ncbi:hypothetical protein [Dokdonella koreensis]|uniref:Lipoprotein n=1 Tax=Dokdonella koreensis DS-123 TaxID=1300342 RepID=A0A160DRM9_9GAMM|nr:hypothetical protein [Dokdonella koreensis]ANB16838.1 Hypothetical protein I596_802 [Dokdonella koreensis DS-123]
MGILSKRLALACALVALAACGKKTDPADPLGYVPADTPYVAANVEVLPDATVEVFATQMKAFWPLMFEQVRPIVGELEKDPKHADAARVVRALFDEIAPRDTPEKWAEIGFGTKVRSAIYGVGLVPVLRLELADAEAFRATVARVEAKAGTTLGTGRIGDQDLWIVDGGKVQGLMAIQGTHLVLTVAPAEADEALKRRLLGLDRPEQSLAASGALTALNQAEGYLPYGSGYVDLRRIVALIDRDPGYQAFARLAEEAPPALDETCRGELDAIVAKAPRASFGYTVLDAGHMTMHSLLELDPALVQGLQGLAVSPPGSAATGDALLDLSFSLPVLKAKAFVEKQVDAIVAAPYRCEALAFVNEGAQDLQQKLDQTVPPPLSDLTGLRLSLDRFTWKGQDKPDFAGKLLIASDDPATLVSMAQLAVPTLRDVQLTAGGAPVDLPLPPEAAGFVDFAQAALAPKALALAFGTGAAATDLGTWLAEPAATDAQLLGFRYSGRLYGVIGDATRRFADAMPEEQRDAIDSQLRLYALYEQWFKRFDQRVRVTPKGLLITQDVELAKP